MRKFLCVFFFNLSGYFFAQEVSELKFLSLNENVKTLDEIEYYIHQDSTIEERGKTSYVFNKKGIKSLVKYYKPYAKNGAFTSTVTEFDKNDNPILKYSSENDSLFLNKITYEYDEKNKVKKEKHYGKNNLVSESYEFIYDDNGNLKEKIVYLYERYLLKNVYSYDEKNRLILTEVYNQKFDLTSKYGIVYDSDLLIERNNWSINYPNIFKKSINSYDSNNFIKKTVYYENSNVLCEMIFERDEKGNELSVTFNYPDGRKSKTTKKFDHNNNMIEISEWENGEIKSTYYTSYEYDSKNNWIERTWSDVKNDKNPSRTKRIITYFE